MKIETTDVAVITALAEVTDASRCLAICDSDIARLRPHTAWALLPLGLSATDTATMLASMPVERDDDAFRWQVEQLRERHARASQAFSLLRMCREGTATIN